MRTYSPKPGDVQRQWHVIDAADVVLGRLASQTAVLLRGKHKPIFAPHMDTGDHVIIVNADKIVLTAGKAEKKVSYRHSGYPGGLRSTSYTELLAKKRDQRDGTSKQPDPGVGTGLSSDPGCQGSDNSADQQ